MLLLPVLLPPQTSALEMRRRRPRRHGHILAAVRLFRYQGRQRTRSGLGRAYEHPRHVLGGTVPAEHSGEILFGTGCAYGLTWCDLERRNQICPGQGDISTIVWPCASCEPERLPRFWSNPW